jgi:type IV secretory pathway TraG/TraD family ATPase VirD4
VYTHKILIRYFQTGSEVEKEVAKKKKKGKKHPKYLGQVCCDEHSVNRIGPISIERKPFLNQEQSERIAPKEIVLKRGDDSGFFFGGIGQYKKGHYIGMPQGTEGNIVVVGGCGSGKSAGIAKPTLRMWQGAICATDVKGELSDFYADLSKKLFQQGTILRPYIIFDPTQIDGPSYDPFWWLTQDDSSNLINNIQEIALAIIPIQADVKEPFWPDTERGILAAALLYYFQLGLSFSETVCKILEQPLSSLCEELFRSDDVLVRMILGQMSDIKEETIASVDRGLRNKIMLYTTDPYISHAFRGTREGAKCFTWDDLNRYNIFLRIPADKIEQWGGAINLMYTQLIRYLERRPEKYSTARADNIQTLLLMDEFARFSKLEMITSAMSTLRSKNVNICLIIQSVAQLDSIYGEYGRRIIFDNCQYKAILRADDAETQKYLSELIGTCTHRQHSVGEQLDKFMEIAGYSVQISEVRNWIIHPHELSTLDDILLLTPYGFYQVEKLHPSSDLANYVLYSALKKQTGTTKDAKLASMNDPITFVIDNPKRNEGAKILSIEERIQGADKRVAESRHQQRLAQKQIQDEQKKKNQHRNYIIGELVSKYFPEVCDIEPGTKAENAERFEPLEAFMAVLSADKELVEKIKKKSLSRIS